MDYRAKPLIVGITICLFCLPIFQASGDCSHPKEEKTEDLEFVQCLNIELIRLEETYSLLDTFAQKIWPG